MSAGIASSSVKEESATAESFANQDNEQKPTETGEDVALDSSKNKAAARPEQVAQGANQTFSNQESQNGATGKSLMSGTQPTQSPSKTDSLLQTQSTVKPNLPLPQLPENFASNLVVKVSEELKLHISGKSSAVRVVIKPESLGEVSLRVTMENGKLAARIEATQPAVKNALEAQLPQMRATLATHGIDIQHFDVVSGSEMQFQQSKEGSPSQQHSRSKREMDVDVAEKFNAVKDFGYNTVEYIL